MKLTKILLAVTLLFLIVSAVSAQSHDKSDTTKMHHKMMKEKHEMDKSCCNGEGKKECICDNSSQHETGADKTKDVEIWNKICPVQGEEVDTEAPTVEYKGKLIGFCCPGCDKKFRKDPERYMKNLSEDGAKFVKK